LRLASTEDSLLVCDCQESSLYNFSIGGAMAELGHIFRPAGPAETCHFNEVAVHMPSQRAYVLDDDSLRIIDLSTMELISIVRDVDGGCGHDLAVYGDSVIMSQGDQLIVLDLDGNHLRSIRGEFERATPSPLLMTAST